MTIPYARYQQRWVAHADGWTICEWESGVLTGCWFVRAPRSFWRRLWSFMRWESV